MPESIQMQAAVYRAYGGPERVSITPVIKPTCPADGALVRIHASTVNRTDCGFLRGKPAVVRLFSGLRRPNAQILGCEMAGEVVAIGSNASRFNVGDRVMAFMDDDYGFGGHAQFVALPRHAMAAQIPESFTFEEAAAAFEGSHYALFGIRAANIQAGYRVLINGATGAIGSAAVQLIHALGAHITAVCATEHIDLVTRLGANRVVDYQHEDFTELDEQFDVVFDAVGKSTFGSCRKILTKTGSYLSTELGPYGQNPLLALVTSVIGSRKVLFPLPSNKQEDADYVSGLMHQGCFRPVVDRSYRLEQIADAYRYVETGMKTGNVVIRIP